MPSPEEQRPRTIDDYSGEEIDRVTQKFTKTTGRMLLNGTADHEDPTTDQSINDMRELLDIVTRDPDALKTMLEKRISYLKETEQLDTF